MENAAEPPYHKAHLTHEWSPKHKLQNGPFAKYLVIIGHICSTNVARGKGGLAVQGGTEMGDFRTFDSEGVCGNVTHDI